MNTRIVVLGAGYAGLAAANRLAAARRPDTQIHLVTERDAFVHRVRLHEAVAAGRAVTVPLRAALHADVHAVLGRADGIDAAAGELVLGDGTRLGFDRLIVATGSVPVALPDAVAPGSPEGALAARRVLADRPRAGVTVLGGGLTGVETACALAAAGREVRLVTSRELVPGSLRRTAARVARELTRLGVELREHAGADARDGSADDGRIRIACVGFVPGPLARESGLPVDEDGRLVLDPTLRVPGLEHVLGAGDAADVASRSTRMSCALGLPAGRHAAGVVLDELRGAAPSSFEPVDRGWCIATGPGRAVVEARASEGARSTIVFSGAPAGVVKRALVGGAFAAPVWAGRRLRRGPARDLEFVGTIASPTGRGRRP